MKEFEIIQRFFQQPVTNPAGILVNIGDDAAVLAATDKSRVVCTDTLNEGVHFPIGTAPHDIAHKALAVNLSDIAAMGARPQFALLALSMPSADESWLEEFAQGFFNLAQQFGVNLIGGDLTRGPLSVNVTLIGEPEYGNFLTRSKARVGDHIYVTGSLGDAGLALQLIRAGKSLTKQLQQRFNCPVPRVKAGLLLADIANSCIDVSDGLLADLGHILQQSQVGAKLFLDKIPHHSELSLALTAGDDYELCFTVAPENVQRLDKVKHLFDCAVTRIGTIVENAEKIVDGDDKPILADRLGYQHF